jgi:pimeloyl-ACP methyl ester carboxylesterase
MSQPRIVYAMKSERVRVHTPGRTLPIIVVPDLLCTRLTEEETDELIWNPKGTPWGSDPHGYAADLERMSQMSAELVPDETHPFEHVSQNARLPKVKHGRSMLLDVYKKLFEDLETGMGAPSWYELTGMKRELYFCGYDFRQDNARSALRLSEMVDEALDETGESKVVLIGHGMGGQICRYYCRALGGEPKVHQLFLIGCPLLGAEGAFAALKHGLEGMYVGEIRDGFFNHDPGGVVFECMNQMEDMLLAGGAHGTGAAASLFGDLYMLLCLSEGKWLSRAETRTFVRQMPSVYQLMPGSVYCKEHLHWVMFDPMATGVAPTGYMVPLPTVVDMHMEGIAAIVQAVAGQEAANRMRESVNDFLAGRAEGTPSARSTRNAMPFIQLVAKTIEFIGRANALIAAINWNAPDLGAEFAKLGPPGKALFPDAMLLMTAWKSLGGQLGNTFIDCRNPKSLYEDIYTGLFDAVDERPLTAASLPLFYRFDDVLTVDAREAKPVSLLELIKQLLLHLLPEGLLHVLYGIGAPFGALFWGDNVAETYARWSREHHSSQVLAEQDDQLAQDKRRRERKKPKAYIPPSTYAIYSNGDRMAKGCLVQPVAYVSNDDNNEVRSRYVPDLIPMMGDGAVAGRSAFPDASLVSATLVGHEVPDTRHMDLPGAQGTTSFINQKIYEKLEEFLKG